MKKAALAKLAAARKKLPAREEQVLSLMWDQCLDATAVAEVINQTPNRVIALHNSAVIRLQDFLDYSTYYDTVESRFKQAS